METVVIQRESEETAQPAAAVVVATELTRRYGEGDTPVDALRGCSIDVRRGELTAVMGPSGWGKSTLMHILAGVLAAILPARRASRLNVLEALQYE